MPTAGRRAGAAGIWLAWIAGAALLVVAAVTLWRVDDSCPQWEDEGTMAAPASPYSLLMCAPLDPPLTWPVLLLVVGGAALALVLRRRWAASGGWRVLVGGTIALVAAPTLTLGLLHVALPQDCLTGRTETGSCSRDRELR